MWNYNFKIFIHKHIMGFLITNYDVSFILDAYKVIKYLNKLHEMFYQQ